MYLFFLMSPLISSFLSPEVVSFTVLFSKLFLIFRSGRSFICIKFFSFLLIFLILPRSRLLSFFSHYYSLLFFLHIPSFCYYVISFFVLFFSLTFLILLCLLCFFLSIIILCYSFFIFSHSVLMLFLSSCFSY